MVKSKLFLSSEGGDSKVSTEKSKGHASNPKRYRVNRTQRKTQGQEPEADTNFKGNCSDLEVYIFDLRPKASENFARMMKELERYLGETYRDTYHPKIKTDTPETPTPDPEITTIIMDTSVKHPKTDANMTYLE